MNTTTPPGKSAGHDPYAVWRLPNYRLYTGSWFLLMFAKAIETVALQWEIVRRPDLQDSQFLYLGALGLVQALPVMLLALPAGQIADRYNRKRIMLLTLLLGTAGALGLAGVAYYKGPIEVMFGFILLMSVGQALGSPSRSALLPAIVPAPLFSHAVTWSNSTFQISQMVGPAIGGLLIVRNITDAFALAAVCRLACTLMIWTMRYQPKPSGAPRPVNMKELLSGIRFVYARKVILATITLDLFAVLLGGAVYLIPVFAAEVLHVGAVGFGALRAAEAVGALCMAMALAHLPPIQRAGRAMLLSVAVFGVATAVFGMSRWFWLSLIAIFIIGASDTISVVVRHTLVQMLTPDAMRGRVSAINNIFIVASNDLGGLESGLTAQYLGPVVSVVAGGIGAVLVVIGCAWMWPEVRRLGSLAAMRPDETLVAEEKAEEEFAGRG